MYSVLKYLFLLVFFLCIACKSNKNINAFYIKSDTFLFNWWERYYPVETINDNGIRLTHLEFFENGDARFHIINNINDNNYSGTGNEEWQYRDETKNSIDIFA